MCASPEWCVGEYVGLPRELVAVYSLQTHDPVIRPPIMANLSQLVAPQRARVYREPLR